MKIFTTGGGGAGGARWAILLLELGRFFYRSNREVAHLPHLRMNFPLSINGAVGGAPLGDQIAPARSSESGSPWPAVGRVSGPVIIPAGGSPHGAWVCKKTALAQDTGALNHRC